MLAWRHLFRLRCRRRAPSARAKVLRIAPAGTSLFELRGGSITSIPSVAALGLVATHLSRAPPEIGVGADGYESQLAAMRPNDRRTGSQGIVVDDRIVAASITVNRRKALVGPHENPRRAHVVSGALPTRKPEHQQKPDRFARFFT